MHYIGVCSHMTVKKIDLHETNRLKEHHYYRNITEQHYCTCIRGKTEGGMTQQVK